MWYLLAGSTILALYLYYTSQNQEVEQTNYNINDSYNNNLHQQGLVLSPEQQQIMLEQQYQQAMIQKQLMMVNQQQLNNNTSNNNHSLLGVYHSPRKEQTYEQEFHERLVSRKKKANENNIRMFGKYRCKKCKRIWQSGNSWRDASQKCKTCNISVFAYELKPLEDRQEGEDKIDRTKPHRIDLCGKCEELGYNCKLKY